MRELHTLITKAVALSAVLLAVTLTLSVAAPTILAPPAWADELPITVVDVEDGDLPSTSAADTDVTSTSAGIDASFNIHIGGYVAAQDSNGDGSSASPSPAVRPPARGKGATKTGLPQTGDRLEAWIMLALIAVLLIVLGIMALRQSSPPTTPAPPEKDPDDEDAPRR
ncbi:MAG: hypothetical protein LBR39_00965 [Coriobacteriales bacterium]|jgi:hypothetical protein|nr:hypothetical protein [Coriobacteriales bacterium]